MSPSPIIPRRPIRPTAPARRVGPALGLAVAVGAASLAGPAVASAERVTSPQPWKASNTYRATADIDGRTQPRLEPRAKVDHVRKGQWVRISCQTRGQQAFGSNLWAKVGAYFVPDQLLKTFTDGPLRGVPSCGPGQQPPAQPSVSPSFDAAQTAAFGPLPAGTVRRNDRTTAKTGRDGIVMFRLFIPDAQAGGRLLKGDGRGWSSDPSQAVASRASLFWNTGTGRISLSIKPTHTAAVLPSSIWFVKPVSILGTRVFVPKKYALTGKFAGNRMVPALRIDGAADPDDVNSTDLRARSTNEAQVSGSGRTISAKLSLLNSVTNDVPSLGRARGVGAWSVDTTIRITQNSSGSFSVSTAGNGYPAFEAYWYPKVGAPRTIFQRRIHENAFQRTISIPRFPKVGTGTIDPGGGIAALDLASDLSCRSTSGGGSTCNRDDGARLNPLPELIAPENYTTRASDPAG